MLWVTKIVVAPTSATMRISSMFSRSRVNSSSAPNGSSSSRMSAPVCSSRASATRCCIPPESCAGKEKTEILQPHQVQQIPTRVLVGLAVARAVDLGRQQHVLDRGAPFQQGRLLEHHAPRRGAGPCTGRSCTTRSPESGAISPEISRSSVDLPQPDGPTSETNCPSRSRSSRPSSATTAATGEGLADPLSGHDHLSRRRLPSPLCRLRVHAEGFSLSCAAAPCRRSGTWNFRPSFLVAFVQSMIGRFSSPLRIWLLDFRTWRRTSCAARRGSRACSASMIAR